MQFILYFRGVHFLEGLLLKHWTRGLTEIKTTAIREGTQQKVFLVSFHELYSKLKFCLVRVVEEVYVDVIVGAHYLPGYANLNQS